MIYTKLQQEAFDCMKGRKNIFITGPAGTGKSTLIKDYRIYCSINNIKIAITALTGIAALNIKGKTLHSWAGIKLGNSSAISLHDMIEKDIHSKRKWTETEVLVIDEISMLSLELFEKLDYVGKRVRRVLNKPFGGIQLILLGDFCQLPPVKCDSFCFESELWDKTIVKTIQLTEVVRQSDKIFVDCLSEIRIGNCSENTTNILKSRMIEPITKNDIKPTVLYSTRLEVSTKNNTELYKLLATNSLYEFDCVVEFQNPNKIKINKAQLKEKIINNSPCEEILQLAIGAQVMLIYNLSSTKVNGSRGVVVALESEFPIVKFLDGEELMIAPYTWEIEENNSLKITITQVPLILAYSTTIHKCQGTTLDYVQIDIGNKIFEYGQAYTALSRVKNLEGLFISDFCPESIFANPKVIEFYRDK